MTMLEDPDIIEVTSSPEPDLPALHSSPRTRTRKRPPKGKERAWIDTGEVIEISSSDDSDDEGRGRVKRRRVSGSGRTGMAQEGTEKEGGVRSPSVEMAHWMPAPAATVTSGSGLGGASAVGAGGSGGVVVGAAAAAAASSSSAPAGPAADVAAEPFPIALFDADSPPPQPQPQEQSQQQQPLPQPHPQPHPHPAPTPPTAHTTNPLFDPSNDSDSEEEYEDLLDLETLQALEEIDRSSQREVYEIPSSPPPDDPPAPALRHQPPPQARGAAADDFLDLDFQALDDLDRFPSPEPQAQLHQPAPRRPEPEVYEIPATPPPAPHLNPAQPVAAQPPQAAPALTPDEIHTHALASILEIIPDVDPAHVSSLIEQYFEQYKEQVVQPVLHVLFESDYPKIVNKGKKRANDAEEGARKRVEVDYASLERGVGWGRVYGELALHQLQMDFPRAPKPYLRRRLLEHNGLYAPTWLSMKKNEKAHREEGVELEYPAKIVPYALKGKGKELYDAEFEEELRWVRAREAEERDEQDKLLAEQAEEEEYERNGDGIECGCCFATYPFNKITQCPETHLFCKDCITRHVESKLGDMNPVITCIDQSGCKAPLPDSELRSFLPEKLWDLYERLRAQKAVEDAGIEGLESCPFCEWKCVIELPFEEERLFRCGNEEGGCGAISCRGCKKHDHLPKSCEEAEKDKVLDGQHSVEEAMTKALMRNCPKCKKAFIKSEGCNKMTCPYCNTMSCYVCRQEVKSYDHFDQAPGGTARAGASRAKKCPLYEQVEQRHAEEVKAAAEKAMAELKAKRPEIDENEIKVDIPKAPPPGAPRLPGVGVVFGGGLMDRIGGAGPFFEDRGLWGLPGARWGAGAGAEAGGAGGWGAGPRAAAAAWGEGAGAGWQERMHWGAVAAALQPVPQRGQQPLPPRAIVVPPQPAQNVAMRAPHPARYNVAPPRRGVPVPQRPAERAEQRGGAGVIVVPPLARAPQHQPQPAPRQVVHHVAQPHPQPAARAAHAIALPHPAPRQMAHLVPQPAARAAHSIAPPQPRAQIDAQQRQAAAAALVNQQFRHAALFGANPQQPLFPLAAPQVQQPVFLNQPMQLRRNPRLGGQVPAPAAGVPQQQLQPHLHWRP